VLSQEDIQSLLVISKYGNCSPTYSDGSLINSDFIYCSQCYFFTNINDKGTSNCNKQKLKYTYVQEYCKKILLSECLRELLDE
jgi:hypothetical protein